MAKRVFTSEELVKAVKEQPPNSTIIFDEASQVRGGMSQSMHALIVAKQMDIALTVGQHTLDRINVQSAKKEYADEQRRRLNLLKKENRQKMSSQKFIKRYAH